MAEMDEALQQQVGEFYTLQQQLQMVLYQKQQFKMQLEDTELALSEVDKSEGEIYKSAGMILIKSSKENASSDLNERREFINVRLGTLIKQEEAMRDRLDEMKAKIEAATKKK